ncbi:MAG TPA: glycosyltransferase [Gemmatimonadaceae bacterium]|jgi:glycosyltransferase involved in cell wall biosynthesis
MPRIALVVPCYNEARRLDVPAFDAFAAQGDAHLVLVNDGSTDTTSLLLRELASRHDNITALDLAQNSGKAEAVRRGLLEAIASGADFVGFWDADLATPFDALPALVERLDTLPHLQTILGSRVRLLGRTIDRRAVRHYTGRVFATAVSLTLRLPVYDTQCGAKLFRVTPHLERAVALPFLSRWIFDVELLARLGIRNGRYSPDVLLESVYEYPLREWRDVGGSRLRFEDFPTAALDLWRIHQTYIAPRRVESQAS